MEEIEKLDLIENNENTEVLDISETNIQENSHKLSILETYGENLSSKEFITDPAIGREQEINEMILALITPDKSALLVGKPGIGKTAIVEGLGYRINIGQAPDALKGWNIIKINIPSLLGSSKTEEGNMESRLELLLQELKTVDHTILFIDEVHLLVNKAASNNGIDFANMLKPGLDRGDIKVIGATTTEEYERYILRDKAFVRRFQKIEVSEPTREMNIQIMKVME